MSVYSDILKRSYFDGSMGKALQNFADQSGSSAHGSARMRVSAVFDSDAVGKIEGIIDVEDGQGWGMAACKWLITIKSPPASGRF